MAAAVGIMTVVVATAIVAAAPDTANDNNNDNNNNDDSDCEGDKTGHSSNYNQPLCWPWTAAYNSMTDSAVDEDICKINKLLKKLSQILLCTIWTDQGLFDCHV